MRAPAPPTRPIFKDRQVARWISIGGWVLSTVLLYDAWAARRRP